MRIDDKEGIAVAMLAADDAVELASWRVPESEATRVLHSLIYAIVVECGERGCPCPEGILIDFRKYLPRLWV